MKSAQIEIGPLHLQLIHDHQVSHSVDTRQGVNPRIDLTRPCRKKDLAEEPNPFFEFFKVLTMKIVQNQGIPCRKANNTPLPRIRNQKSKRGALPVIFHERAMLLSGYRNGRGTIRRGGKGPFKIDSRLAPLIHTITLRDPLPTLNILIKTGNHLGRRMDGQMTPDMGVVEKQLVLLDEERGLQAPSSQDQDLGLDMNLMAFLARLGIYKGPYDLGPIVIFWNNGLGATIGIKLGPMAEGFRDIVEIGAFLGLRWTSKTTPPRPLATGGIPSQGMSLKPQNLDPLFYLEANIS